MTDSSFAKPNLAKSVTIEHRDTFIDFYFIPKFDFAGTVKTSHSFLRYFMRKIMW